MRKRVLLLAVVLMSSTFALAQVQEINWMSFEEALAAQKKNPKKIMMDVYTNWCGPCKMLDKNTFHNKDVVEYINKNYYAVKFNGEGNSVVNYNGKAYKNANYKEELKNRRNSAHELTRALGVRAYPTIVYFNEEGKVIQPISGYMRPQQIELYLKLFHTDDYKNIKTQEEFNTYYKAFKAEFQE
ncbi:thioredoxin fold domain-containing protein [uncultured Psychroserpens sp.]|uniref:thioredoxin family protein n=1 Tax=uncultured Psychroserpens sp. TaxID=255436 RepID=UPI0026302C44|nr:thioredoxin fold domain-containing protein [uncultured Psychroserpens sp.]